MTTVQQNALFLNLIHSGVLPIQTVLAWYYMQLMVANVSKSLDKIHTDIAVTDITECIHLLNDSSYATIALCFGITIISLLSLVATVDAVQQKL